LFTNWLHHGGPFVIVSIPDEGTCFWAAAQITVVSAPGEGSIAKQKKHMVGPDDFSPGDHILTSDLATAIEFGFDFHNVRITPRQFKLPGR
jgi:hypothetical protein